MPFPEKNAFVESLYGFFISRSDFLKQNVACLG